MAFTRRGILGATALLQSSLLGGCFGGNDGTKAGSASSGGSDDGASSSTDSTGTATQTSTPTGTPVPESDFAAATRAILDEYEWFHGEYDAAIRGFRRTANGVVGVIADLETADDRSASSVAALRSAATDVANYVNANLAAHFRIDRALRVGDNVYVREFERAVSRNDASLQDSALSRARAFYRSVVSRSYIEHEFSRRPVYGPLYDTLVPGGADRIVMLAGVDDDFVTWAHPDRTESSATDGIDQHDHEFPSGYRLYTHAHGHQTGHVTSDHENEPPYDRLYAYGDDGVALLGDTTGYRNRLHDFEPELTGLFGPAQSPDRTAGLYAFVGEVDSAFTACPLYVERFDSPAAARRVVEGDDTDISTEGTETFANREWSRVFYELDGTTIYAYRLRAGATTVTTRPSDVPWENRADWTVGLGPTWIGTTGVDG